MNQASFEFRSMSHRLLLCTLIAPRPDAPMQGLYHVALGEELVELGVTTHLFAPMVWLPPGAGLISNRFEDRRRRGTRYAVGRLRVMAPRVLFVFNDWVRFWLAERFPRLVAWWFRRAVGRSLRAYLREFRPDQALVHGAMPWAGLVERECGRAGIPYGIIEHSWPDVMRLGVECSLTEFYAEALESARHVFTVSEVLADRLRHVAEGASVTRIENGAAIEVGDSFRIAASCEGKRLLLCATHYYRRKGLEELVEAFEAVAGEHPDAHLVLVTDAPQSLKVLVHDAKARDQIEIRPLMKHVEVLAWMRHAELFVLPSWEESFGVVFAEALVQGTPIVMSSSCGLAETLPLKRAGEAGDEAVGYVVVPQSVESLKAVLSEALADPAGLERMGELARELGESRFCWKEAAASIVRGLSDRSAA